MPRSVSLVGLAQRGVIPQNNSTLECSFCDPVVLKACEFVHLVNEAHRRPTLIRWSAVGLAAGALLFGGGFWLGTLVH
jgi:hypothetical protein